MQVDPKLAESWISLYHAEKNWWYYRHLYLELNPNSHPFYFDARLNFLYMAVLKLYSLYSQSKNDKYSFYYLIRHLEGKHRVNSDELHKNLKLIKTGWETCGKPVEVLRNKFIAHKDPNRYNSNHDRDLPADSFNTLLNFGNSFLLNVAKVIDHPLIEFKYDYKLNMDQIPPRIENRHDADNAK